MCLVYLLMCSTNIISYCTPTFRTLSSSGLQISLTNSVNADLYLKITITLRVPSFQAVLTELTTILEAEKTRTPDASPGAVYRDVGVAEGALSAGVHLLQWDEKVVRDQKLLILFSGFTLTPSKTVTNIYNSLRRSEKI